MKPAHALKMRRFITSNMRLAPVPTLPAIRLYTPHSGTGLSRIAADDHTPPYWAYPWGGGLALARYLFDTPQTIAGQRVLDLGTGAGLVAIAAAMAGAAHVRAADIDPNAAIAAMLNAEANGAAIDVLARDLLDDPLEDLDVVLMGDVFYDPEVAERMLPFAAKCAAAGRTVLIGDPLRAHLPRTALRQIAQYTVPDVGNVDVERQAGVFTLAA